MLDQEETAMERLPDGSIDQGLAELSGWQRKANAIHKEYRFADFLQALAFVNHIGSLAEEANHHPDIELGWGRVAVSLSTHDAGGVTKRDLALARRIDG